MPPKDIVQPRRGTAAEWAAKTPSPVLKLGELGVETDTHRMKIGDGVTAWSALGYIAGTFDLENVPVQVARDTTANLEALTDPFLSGQLVYDQTTGRMKIGDGETLWPNLPDPGKQFKNVITVAKDGVKGSADFICSDAVYNGSDAACIQAVLNSVSSGTLINFADGEYNLTSKIISSLKSFYLKGNGNVSFKLDASLANNIAFTFSGTQVETNTLSQNSLTGTDTIHVTTSTTASEGDILTIYNNQQWCPLDDQVQKTGESYKIKSVSGTTITLYEPLLRDYTISDVSSIVVYRPITIIIDGIKFINSSGNSIKNYYALSLNYCTNSLISNCLFDNNGYAAVMLNRCFNFSVENTNIKNCVYAGYGYGIIIMNACAYININNTLIENCRHCVTIGTSDKLALNRGIVVDNNRILAGNISDSHAIDSHPSCIDYTVTNNYVRVYPGYAAFYDGSQHSIFSNNQVYGNGVARRSHIDSTVKEILNNEIHGGYLYNDNYQNVIGGHNGTLLISHNSANGGDYGVKITSGNNKYLSVKDNVFENFSHNAVYAILKSPENYSATVDISNNFINDITLDAILLRHPILSDSIYLSTNNNKIKNAGISSSRSCGINISDFAGAEISLNQIIDTGDYTHTINASIIISGNSDYNNIHDNILIGYTDNSVTYNGSNNTVTNNKHITYAQFLSPANYTITTTDPIGIMWDTASSEKELIYVDINGHTVNPGDSFFNEHPIFGNIKVCLRNRTTGEFAFGSDNKGTGLTLDGTAGDAFVQYPTCKVKYSYSGTFAIIYLITLDGTTTDFITHPAAYGRGGTIKDYIYISMCEAYGYMDGSTFKLGCALGKQPITGGVNYPNLPNSGRLTLTDAETYANNAGYGVESLWSESMVQLYMLFEYGTFDIPSKLGKGVINLATGSGFAGKLTGADSGYTNLNEWGTGAGTGANGLTPVWWRGRENPYGNCVKFLLGLNCFSTGEYRVIKRDGTGAYTAILASGSYEIGSGTLPLIDGYISQFQTDSMGLLAFIPLKLDGDDHHYTCDYYEYPRGAPSIVAYGEAWYRSTKAGVCSKQCLLSTISNQLVGCRIECM